MFRDDINLSRKRRSSFDICFEIIQLCNYPGLSQSKLLTRANLNHGLLKKILFGLIEGELIKVETRPLSPEGHQVETDYYFRTEEGKEILDKFEDIRGRLTRSGSP